jgi:hypothetical protein
MGSLKPNNFIAFKGINVYFTPGVLKLYDTAPPYNNTRITRPLPSVPANEKCATPYHGTSGDLVALQLLCRYKTSMYSHETNSRNVSLAALQRTLRTRALEICTEENMIPLFTILEVT